MSLRAVASLTAAIAAAGATALAAAGPAAADTSFFTSPSGNIYCVIDPGQARCDIRDRDWSPPPRPADCSSYTGYGQGIAIQPGGPAQFVCAGDTTYNDNGALAYGNSISAGSLTCTSEVYGMSCRDNGSGHGFTLSRRGYLLF